MDWNLPPVARCFKVYYTSLAGVPNQWRLVAARDELDAYVKAFPCQKK